MGDRAEREGLEHIEHGVRHVSSEDSGKERLSVLFLDHFFTFLGIGVAVLGEVLVHGCEDSAEELHRSDTILSDFLNISSRLVHVGVESSVAIISRSQAKDLSEDQIVKLLFKSASEFVHADLVEVFGALAILVNDIGQQVLDVGSIHGVGVAFACDLDHELKVLAGDQQFEAALVLNQVLEDGAGVQGLLDVSLVFLRHVEEESLDDHKLLFVEDVVHLVVSGFGFSSVGGATLSGGGGGLVVIIGAAVIPVDELRAGVAGNVSVTCVVLNEELHAE